MIQSTRREWMTGMAAATGATVLAAAPLTAKAEPATKPVALRYCLNTSTIRGQNIPLEREVEMIAQAGYQAVEPWMGELEKHVQEGHSLKDLGKKIADLGLTVESAIGFAQWIVDDPEARKKGLEQARRDMDLLLQIGGKRVAAPPVGAHQAQAVSPDLPTIAARYRDLLDLGQQMGIVPQLEVWGFSPTLGRLSETVYAVTEAKHPLACILPDIYHLHRGGSDFTGLKLLSGQAVHVFHVNDYPEKANPKELNDADRVHVGDGVAPVASILKTLMDNGFQGHISLELFNRDYWKQDAAEVLKVGLEKMKVAVEKARKA